MGGEVANLGRRKSALRGENNALNFSAYHPLQINTGRHSLSARFTCQLAVTELNYNGGGVSAEAERVEPPVKVCIDRPDIVADIPQFRTTAAADTVSVCFRVVQQDKTLLAGHISRLA